jgi:hypothetical protein
MQRVRRLVTRSWWWPIVREHDTEPAELLGAMLGSTLLVVGINAGLALRSGGVRSRRRSAILMFGSWFAIAAAFAHSDITNTGVVVYGVVTLAAGWVYVRLGVPS